MKTKLIIEIETADSMEVFPEEGQTEEDFKGKENELKDFREEYVKELHKDVVNHLKEYINDGMFEENFIDDLEEQAIEDFESFDDYEIKVSIEEEK